MTYLNYSLRSEFEAVVTLVLNINSMEISLELKMVCGHAISCSHGILGTQTRAEDNKPSSHEGSDPTIESQSSSLKFSSI